VRGAAPEHCGRKGKASGGAGNAAAKACTEQGPARGQGEGARRREGAGISAALRWEWPQG